MASKMEDNEEECCDAGDNLEEEGDISKDDDGPSNEFVLNVAFMTFLSFLLIEAVFALIGHSKSMMVDAMAMSVDAFTYLFNLMAERLKHRHLNKHEQQYENKHQYTEEEDMMMRQRMLDRKIQKHYLELVPPLISVVALISVSIWAILDSLDTIIHHSPHELQQNNLKPTYDAGQDPNVSIMFVFSAANLLLDIVNMAYFARLKHFANSLNNLLGFTSNPTDDNDDNKSSKLLYKHPPSTPPPLFDEKQETTSLLNRQIPQQNYSIVDNNNNVCEIKSMQIQRLSTNNENNDHKTNEYNNSIPAGHTEEECLSDKTEDSGLVLNLNMCSAYTHVMADTMRSITVLVVAGLAYCFQSIDNDLADASGAVIVSIITLISLGPLLIGIFSTWSELRVHTAMKRQLTSSSPSPQ